MASVLVRIERRLGWPFLGLMLGLAVAVLLAPESAKADDLILAQPASPGDNCEKSGTPFPPRHDVDQLSSETLFALQRNAPEPRLRVADVDARPSMAAPDRRELPRHGVARLKERHGLAG